MRVDREKWPLVTSLLLLLVLHLWAVINACICIGNESDDVSVTSYVITAVLVITTGVIDVGVVVHLLGMLKREEIAYTADVTKELEESLEEYREQAERERRIAENIGTVVECQVMMAREALARGDLVMANALLNEGRSTTAASQVARCENVVVSSVLESKTRQCAEAGVELVSDVRLPKDLTMDDVELAALFFNLIDNALHECEHVRVDDHRPPQIVVRGSVEAGQVFIEVRNPCREGAAQKQRVASKRADVTLLHGLGTSIVSDIAARHGGIAEFTDHEGTFVADVMFPLNQ